MDRPALVFKRLADGGLLLAIERPPGEADGPIEIDPDRVLDLLLEIAAPRAVGGFVRLPARRSTEAIRGKDSADLRP